MRDRGIFERPPGSGHWWIRYSDEFGKERREAIGTKALAKKLYTVRKAQVLERRHLPESLRRKHVSVKLFLAEYLERKKAHRSYRDMKRFAKLWTEFMGEKALRQVLPGDVQRYRAKRLKDVSTQTVIHELSFLRGAFNAAIGDYLCEHNPVRKVGTADNTRIRYLSDDEEKRLLEALPDDAARALVTFAIHTGLRQEEQFALKWSYIDLPASVIRLPKTKSGKGRVVYLNETAKAVLRSLPRVLRSPWVWSNRIGLNHLNAHNFYQRVFAPATVAAKLDDFVWHDLRHTFASRLVMAGVHLQAVKELLGHKDVKTTLRYAHLAPSHTAEAVRVLDEARKTTGTKTGTKEA